MSSAFSCDLTFGAQVNGKDRTRFRFWAPAQERVDLMVEGAAPLAMRKAQHGWFEVEAPCGSGTCYRYRLTDGTMVPDPAARAQQGDVDSPSIVVDPTAYQWRMPAWRGRPWHETILYELHVGLYGGFRKLAEQLPVLATLGITAVELMPVAEFPGGRNWGYDGVLPYAPESSYGTPEDLKSLIDTAHEVGLMVFLDVVYNHFGPDGNWLNHYAPGFFREDLRTPWGGGIDFRRPEVQTFFVENAVYWLNEYRFDGLRFDAVHAIAPTEWLRELAAGIRSRIEPGRHVHLVLENDDNQASLLADGFDAQWADDYHHVLHVLLTGEKDGYYADYAENTCEQLARVLREGFAYQGEYSPHRGCERGEPSAELPPTAFVNFLQNHDQIGNRAFGERLTTLADPTALRAAIALLLLSPQIPMIFMGEENGARNPFLFFTSHNDELADAVRNGRRAEFAAFAQFADPARREAIPDPNDPKTFEASRPAHEPESQSHREFYRGLLRLRHQKIMPSLSGALAIGSRCIGPAAVLARWRMGDGAILSILVNLASSAVPLPTDGVVPMSPPIFMTIEGEEIPSSVPAYTTIVWLEGLA